MIAWPPCRWLRPCATSLLLALVACGGDGGSQPTPVADITLDTDAVVLDATGQTRQLTATALDDGGDPISGAPIELG